ncbi:unnamed protein product [Parnassius apollo]|uniref:(apollo) hypothetical protein n=1 Tax=Parnassius apollo TaxID=110799 RepID=A0A8S3WLC3_PARAO|nr:unnamed protein product [Parnassius apollo]
MEATVLRNYQKFGIPEVLGYIDGTHIKLKKPTQHEELYVNRKGEHTLNAQMVCDSSLKILNVCARYPGATHDSFIWRFSALQKVMMNLNGEGNTCWLLGDSGYPLEPRLLTPILNAEENTPQSRYTNTHIRSRNSIERCFGVLKSRFRRLLSKMEYEPTKVGCIVNACAVLHNVCITAGLSFPDIVDEEALAPDASTADHYREIHI